jgi:N-methylhydantoinase B
MNPAELQVLSSRLQGLAEEMGVALIRSAHSANIKERHDCSTALFDATGEMVSQAEHQPVHLGALPDALRAAIAVFDPDPGDIVLLNDPYQGGSHLPDLTLVSRIADEDRATLGYAVSRAHHADVGGNEPGSMPAGATSIFQEGVRVPPVRLVRRGELVPDVLALLLANMRKPDERLADLRAQLAAHHVADLGLRSLGAQYGVERLRFGMKALLDYGERQMASCLEALRPGVYEASDVLEGDGVDPEDIHIRVRIDVAPGAVSIDFTGTDPQCRGNFNCPLAVTKSACYFAIRAICAPELLACGGAFRMIHVSAPASSLVNATYPAAVAAGNVETASRISDVVISALAQTEPVIAQGQGTLNNVSFGNNQFTYYETIGGGQGASERGPGLSGAHVAMSNTLNTPVEAVEWEYPLRVEEYALRSESGGAGRHRGGDGVVRSIRVLEPCRVSVLSERRKRPPAGVAGGTSGACGRNELNGQVIPGKATFALESGDVLTIHTPGGGGFGSEIRSDGRD